MVDQNNAYIQSPGYPGASPSGMCMFEIKKCDADICQYKYVFTICKTCRHKSSSVPQADIRGRYAVCTKHGRLHQ